MSASAQFELGSKEAADSTSRAAAPEENQPHDSSPTAAALVIPIDADRHGRVGELFLTPDLAEALRNQLQAQGFDLSEEPDYCAEPLNSLNGQATLEAASIGMADGLDSKAREQRRLKAALTGLSGVSSRQHLARTQSRLALDSPPPGQHQVTPPSRIRNTAVDLPTPQTPAFVAPVTSNDAGPLVFAPQDTNTLRTPGAPRRGLKTLSGISATLDRKYTTRGGLETACIQYTAGEYYKDRKSKSLSTLQLLKKRDKDMQKFFSEDLSKVPGYLDQVKEPVTYPAIHKFLDHSEVRDFVCTDFGASTPLDDFGSKLTTMFTNCTLFNSPAIPQNLEFFRLGSSGYLDAIRAMQRGTVALADEIETKLRSQANTFFAAEKDEFTSRERKAILKKYSKTNLRKSYGAGAAPPETPKSPLRHHRAKKDRKKRKYKKEKKRAKAHKHQRRPHRVETREVRDPQPLPVTHHRDLDFRAPVPLLPPAPTRPHDELVDDMW